MLSYHRANRQSACRRGDMVVCALQLCRSANPARCEFQLKNCYGPRSNSGPEIFRSQHATAAFSLSTLQPRSSIGIDMLGARPRNRVSEVTPSVPARLACSAARGDCRSSRWTHPQIGQRRELRLQLPGSTHGGVWDRSFRHFLGRQPRARTRRAALRRTRRHLHALMPNVAGSLRAGLSDVVPAATANSTSSFVESGAAGNMLLASHAETWLVRHVT